MDSTSSSETDSKNSSPPLMSTPPRIASNTISTSSTNLGNTLDSMDLSSTTSTGNNLLFSTAKATPMTPSTPSSLHPVKTLYLNNLPQDVKEREMYLLCRSLEGYDGFVLKPPPTVHHGMSAFITFTSAELAQVGYMKLQDFIKDETCPLEWKQVKIDFAKSDTRHHSHHSSSTHHQQSSSSKRARSVDMYTSSPYNSNSYYYGANNNSSDSVSSQPSSPNHSFSASSSTAVNTSQTNVISPRHQQQSPPHQMNMSSQQQQPPSTPPQVKSEKRIKYNNYYASSSGHTSSNNAWIDSQNENSSNFDNNQMLLNTLLSIYNTQQQAQQPPQQPSNTTSNSSNNNNNNSQLLANLMNLVSNQLNTNNGNNSAPSTPSGSATSTPFKSSTTREASGANHGALFSPSTSQAATVLFSPNSSQSANNFQHLRVVTSSTSTPMRQATSASTNTSGTNEANSTNVLHSFQSSTPSTPHHSQSSAHHSSMGLGSVSTPSTTHSGFNVLTPSSNLAAQNTLFVANLPQECSDLDLHGFFSQFYGFVRCKRGHKPFLCFVEFQDSFSAQQAKEMLHHFHLRYVIYNSANSTAPMIHFVSTPSASSKGSVQEDGGQQATTALDEKGMEEELLEKDKILEKVLRCEFAKNRMK